VVLDEFPYLLRGSPELTSALQAVYDDARDDPAAPGARLVLCGSTFAIMSELLSGARPLRGRARLDLVVRPFDFRLSREFWGIEDLDVAFRLHSIMGALPETGDLTDGAPQSLHELDDWLAATVLNPAHALFGEADYLLREDPPATLWAPAGITGYAVINDPASRAQHEVDVLVLAPDEQRHARRAVITALGEGRARRRCGPVAAVLAFGVRVRARHGGPRPGRRRAGRPDPALPRGLTRGIRRLDASRVGTLPRRHKHGNRR
jgi:hypothetical protein